MPEPEASATKGGVIASAIVAHVPTLGVPANTPAYQQTLVNAERSIGAALRTTLRPDVWVILSSHWVATFDWPVTCQARHRGHCVASEAPQLMPGSPYDYPGDPELGAALVDAFNAGGVPSVRNESSHFVWDYGTFVPLMHLDPDAEIPVVVLPSVLQATIHECLEAGSLVHATAQRLGRRAVFLASTALSHVLVRGREHRPTPERVEADQRFLVQLEAGDIKTSITGFDAYRKLSGLEMGGRPLATMLGVTRAMATAGGPLKGRQYGDYAQSSGSGNVVMALAPAPTLARLTN